MTLLGEYKAATAAHASAVSQLHKKIGVSSKGEYEVLKRKAEDARNHAAHAFDELSQHGSDHHCESEP
jgi:hypothetical protein